MNRDAPWPGLGLSAEDISDAFLTACHAELSALKPGNVHRFSPGHGMVVRDFETSAAVSAPAIARHGATVGARIREAAEATNAAVGQNTNLGILLLTAPLAKAAEEVDVGMGLRRRLAVILSVLSVEDAHDAFAAIRLANPAGLGTVEHGDVSHDGPEMTLIEAMHLAADRDRIAHAYVTADEDIFDFALPCLTAARAAGASAEQAITTLHMTLLSEFPDSHISRKHGSELAMEVRDEARRLRPVFEPFATAKASTALAEFDQKLKQKGINPGTTADFVVATIFTDLLSKRFRR